MGGLSDPLVTSEKQVSRSPSEPAGKGTCSGWVQVPGCAESLVRWQAPPAPPARGSGQCTQQPGLRQVVGESA